MTDQTTHTWRPKAASAPSTDRTTMRAARYHSVGQPFTVDTVDRPKVRATDVIVQVKACSIVPNLINVLEHLAQHPALHSPPLPAIYGLDTAGVVVEKGELVHGVELGDRVYVNPMRYCGSCRLCRMGKTRGCEYAVFNGYFGKGAKSPQMFKDYPSGGFAEYMNAPQYSLVKLPPNLSFETASRWGYLGTAYSALRRANVNMSTTVLINGVSGTLGLGAVLFALALGAPKILGVGRNAELLQKVKALAPDRIEVHSTTSSQSVAAWALSQTDNEGADVVIDALPTGASPQAFLAALAALARCGIHVNIGGVYEDVPVNFIRMMNDHQSCIGSYWFTTEEGQQMADLAGSGQVKLGAIENMVFPLDQINTALTSIGSRTGGFSNYVVAP